MITIDIPPVIFDLGFLELRWYGLMVALAIAVVVVWAWRAAKKAGFPEEVIFSAALWAIPFGIVVSRLLHIIDQLDYYITHPGDLIGGGGLTIYGGILGATLGAWVYSKVKGLSFGRLADLTAPGIVIGQAIGRVGCTINGCCYGIPTSLPWGFLYAHPDSYAPLGVSVHPTQVYEIICHLIIFAILWGLRGRLKPDGSLFLVYLSLFSVVRFSMGLLREGTAFIGGFQQAQIIAFLVLLVTIPLLIYRTRWTMAEASTIEPEKVTAEE